MVDGNVTVAHTGLYVAIANGYFDEENVEVSIVSAPANGSDGLVGSGSANFGFTTQDRIAGNLGAETPLPYTAVAAVVQHNTSGIMGRAEDGITGIDQMAGKRYGTRQLPVEQAIIRGLVETESVPANTAETTEGEAVEGEASTSATPTGVTMVTAGTTDEITALQNNTYDCVWVYDWWSVAEANMLDYPVSFFDMADAGAVLDYYTPVIAVNDQFAADNADTVKAFLRALERGYEFAVDDPSAAADILCEQVTGLNPDLVHLAQSYLSTEYIEDAGQWGWIDEGRWSAFNQWLQDNGMVTYTFDPTSGYTMDYL